MTYGDDASRADLSRGLAMMVAAMLLIPGIDAIAKWLAGSVSPGQVAWSRFAFQSLLLLPFVLRGGGLRPGAHLWAHVARGALIALATLLFFTSLADLPLADAIAIFFVSPFILTLLSAVLLGERVGWRRVLAVLAGFGGSLIIIRPSYQVFGTAALLPVGAAFSFALYMVLTRYLVRTASAITMQFYAGVFGGLAMSAALALGAAGGPAFLVPVWPTPGHWALLALLGVIGTGAHMLIVHAVRRVGASLVAPFQYLEIISATLLGVLLFDEFPAPTTWLGVAVIVASGLFVYLRERRAAVLRETLQAAPP